VNLEAPKIIDVKIERLDLGKYRILTVVKDENLKDAILVLTINAFLLVA